MSQIRPRARGKYFNPATNNWQYSPGNGLFNAFDPELELSVWTFSGAVIAHSSTTNVLGAPNEPLPGLTATLTGFSAYRQIPAIPDVGTVHGWNLAKNGGFGVPVGSEWFTVNPATVVGTVVADPLSPSGWSMKYVASAGGDGHSQAIPIEAGKTYSIAAQGRSDGVALLALYIQWQDAGGNTISQPTYPSTTNTTETEFFQANYVAPGNARTMRLATNLNVAGTAYITAIRVKQQATAPLAWSSADQQTLGNKGLVCYEATTNAAADADMEAVGTGSYSASLATLAKDATNKFAGSQSLKVTSSGLDGRAIQTGALAAGQAITASVRALGGDATCRLILLSTPSNATLGTMNNPNTTTWNALRASGTIAGGDTGWAVYLIAGANTVVANFDNLGVENKAYDTLNADPSGLSFTATTRAASSDTEPLDNGFNIADFGRVVTVRFDHAYNAHGTTDRGVWAYYVDANNFLDVRWATDGSLRFRKFRAGIASEATDGIVTAFAAGDELAIGVRHSASIGLELQISKNGGTVATYTLATVEAQTPLTGTPTNYIGRGFTAGVETDGTIGIDRHLKGGVTASLLTAVIKNVTS